MATLGVDDLVLVLWTMSGLDNEKDDTTPHPHTFRPSPGKFLKKRIPHIIQNYRRQQLQHGRDGVELLDKVGHGLTSTERKVLQRVTATGTRRARWSGVGPRRGVRPDKTLIWCPVPRAANNGESTDVWSSVASRGPPLKANYLCVEAAGLFVAFSTFRRITLHLSTSFAAPIFS